MNFQILIKLKDLSKNKTPTDMYNMQKKNKKKKQSACVGIY